MYRRFTTLAIRWAFGAVLGVAGFLLAGPVSAQERGDTPSPDRLKQMSIEELMNLEVTSVSRRPERLSEVASAINVITGKAIHRSGATRLPEALRLAPNLQVAQSNAHDWAVTARGFNGAPLSNNSLANKLLVLMDGRTIYTHLFGGVFWDVQNTLLEDVDRIEVISGPGGTLWGANAVNGVINIVSKPASETQGLLATARAGTFQRAAGAVRYGGQIGPHVSYRLYGQHLAYDHTYLPAGEAAPDTWQVTQGGFRVDYEPTRATTVTVQADAYGGRLSDPALVNLDGQNLLARWTHRFSEASDLSVQAYVDRTWRKRPQPDGIEADLSFGVAVRTYDLDTQHRFPLGTRQSILWGLGYRLIQDDVNNSLPLSLLPPQRNVHLFSAFVQDAVRVVPNRLELTVGAKLEHHEYTGFEVQPGARLAWTPSGGHTLWAAVSRAVRSPSRFDADVLIPNPNGTNLVGSPDFQSENVVAYEVGYRIQPAPSVSLSLNGFYNTYTDLRTLNLSDVGFFWSNDFTAHSGGVEVSGDVQVVDGWHLRGGYTFVSTVFEAHDPAVFAQSEGIESIDPRHQALLQSMLNLPGGFQLDLVGRYVDALRRTFLSPRVPSYFTFDTRLAWRRADWELALVGQNLASERHAEFGAQRLPRGLYASVTWRY